MAKRTATAARPDPARVQGLPRLPWNDDGGTDDCPDCDARVGKLHSLGCWWEECPVCTGQLLGCGCPLTGVSPEVEEVRAVAALRVRKDLDPCP